MSETEARRLLAAVAKKASAMDTAMAERDAAILAAFEAGVNRTDIAAAAGVHFTRVYQIVRSLNRD